MKSASASAINKGLGLAISVSGVNTRSHSLTAIGASCLPRVCLSSVPLVCRRLAHSQAQAQTHAHAHAQEQPINPFVAQADTRPQSVEPPVRNHILSLALSNVPVYGFTAAAVERAVASLGLSQGAMGMFPQPALAIVEFAHKQADDNLKKHLIEIEPSFLSLTPVARLDYCIRYRLSQHIPYLAYWTEALAIQSQPAALPQSIERLARLADTLAHYSGDSSVDCSWYVKRASLAALYAATELHIITDRSNKYQNTWDFLSRRLSDVSAINRVPSEFGQLFAFVGQALGGLAAVGSQKKQ